MAVHFATIADYLQRTTALLPASGDSTVSLWVKFPTIAVNPPAQIPYVIVDNPAIYTDFVAIFINDTVFQYEGDGHDLNLAAPTANVWYYATWVQSGTNQIFYLNGSVVGTFVYNRAAVVNTFEGVGSDSLGTDVADLSVAYLREWTAALDRDQILAEMQSTTAVLNTGLYMDCPMTSDALDISGFGHDWTTVGTPVYVTGPTFPSNSTAATARVLGTPPETFTQDFGDGGYAWFSYTPASATEVGLGFWSFTTFDDPIPQFVQVYSGTPDALVAYPNDDNWIDDDSVPYQIPLVFGTTIYILVKPTQQVSPPQLPYPADTIISTLPGPTSPAAVGSIVVPDESTGFAWAVLDVTTGQPLTFLKLAATNGSAIVLPTDGSVFTVDDDAGGLIIYNAALTSSVSFPWPYAGKRPAGMATDGSTRFYIGTSVAVGGHAAVTAFNVTTGATIQTWVLTTSGAIRGLGVNSDNTIAYFTAAGPGSNVHRWDLVNDVALADLAVGIANYQNGVDLLMLPDDTFINYYHRNGFDDILKHFAADGSVLNTYTIAAQPQLVLHLAQAIDDSNSFWLWMQSSGDLGGTDTNNFYNIKVSDGTFLTSLTTLPEFQLGHYAADSFSAPLARFGAPDTCPFFILREAVNPTPAIGDPVEYLIRRERIFPVISKEQHRLFFSKLQIYLEAGLGLSSGQGSDPILELDWSDDGGHTWSNLHLIQTGKQGQFTRRAMKWQMGSARERLYRIAVTDPVQWTVIDAFLELTEGVS